MTVEAWHPKFVNRSSGSSDTKGKEDDSRTMDGGMLRKVGSFQEFIQYDEVAGNMAPQLFPTHEVQKIALLDLRLFNIDRNDGNILVRFNTEPPNSPSFQFVAEDGNGSPLSPIEPAAEKEEASPSWAFDAEGKRLARAPRQANQRDVTLIPIDHGYCMPDSFEVAWCDWVWYSWKQLKEPLSPELRAYIASLDLFHDMKVLRELVGRGAFLFGFSQLSKSAIISGHSA